LFLSNETLTQNEQVTTVSLPIPKLSNAGAIVIRTWDTRVEGSVTVFGAVLEVR